MSNNTRRGFHPKDLQQFSEESLQQLRIAEEEVAYLLNRGYGMKQTITFVGNHYLLSERQRMAITRAACSYKDLNDRQSKLKHPQTLQGETIHIDGFNTIITLEVALSGSPVLACMDGTIRDLAGLRGTYRIIDVTYTAIQWILTALEEWKIGKAVWYLDAPVSNSKRLRALILELAANISYEIEVCVLNEVDSLLEQKENVVTSDAIILNRCCSWVNLTASIIETVENKCWKLLLTLP